MVQVRPHHLPQRKFPPFRTCSSCLQQNVLGTPISSALFRDASANSGVGKRLKERAVLGTISLLAVLQKEERPFTWGLHGRKFLPEKASSLTCDFLHGEAKHERDGLAFRLLEGEQEVLKRRVAWLEEQLAGALDQEVILRDELRQWHEKYDDLAKLCNKQQQEIQQWNKKYDALVDQYGERQKTVEHLSGILTAITNTKIFRLATRYWAFRQRLAGKRWRTQGLSSSDSCREPDEKTRIHQKLKAKRLKRETLSPAERHCPELFDLLFLPIIDWDFRFQRPQQLASQFARLGHRVFYLQQRTRISGEAFELVTKTPSVFEVSIRGPQQNVYQEAMSEEALAAYVEALSHLRKVLRIGSCAIVVELPYWWRLAQALRALYGWPIIYDCMDYHAGFSTNRPEMLQQEEALLNGANLVVVSSRFLQEIANQFNAAVVRVANACDYEHFSRVPFRPPSVPPTIGYYGAIADWFDADLIADVAELRPDWHFLLVGSTYTADTSRLERLANVEMVGEQPYASLPTFLERMDCLVIPFRLTPLTAATNPVKFFEIMAAGKPLVSVPLAELHEFTSWVDFATSPHQFVEKLEKALNRETQEKAAKRRAFAREHTWEKRLEKFFPPLVQSFPLVSIVVVTFNQLQLTQLCLESVLKRTDWPHLELWVVDNGSFDSTPAYLRKLAAQDNRVKVILNKENLGFPKANNQALAQARGEYLVLLNNDTVVPYTWLARLVRHLASKKEVGLVGAVTNWIGNEAQISVGYESLEEMPAWAEDHMAAHEGETFSISVAAMFCVGMRREVYQKIGPLDERFSLGMFEDDDYALRTREAGWDVLCAEDVFVHHKGKASFSAMPEEAYAKLFERNRKLFEEKWQRPWIPHRYRESKK